MSLQSRVLRRREFLVVHTIWVLGLSISVAHLPAQAVADPNYQTRASHCRHAPPPGTPLSARRTDSGVITRGYTAERLLTYTADAKRLEGGDIVICTEYGRVEIADSDDDHVRLQVRMEGFGEGSDDPAAAARRVIAETDLQSSSRMPAGGSWCASGTPRSDSPRPEASRRGSTFVSSCRIAARTG